MMFFIFVGATGFSYIFRSIGGEAFIIDTAHGLTLGDWGLLAMIFLMGFFSDWIEITLIILPIFCAAGLCVRLGRPYCAKQDY